MVYPVNTPCLAAAIEYAQLGLSIIPIRHRSKLPYLPWTKYQTSRADEAAIRGWWLKEPTAGVAVVCGEVSKVVVLDVDPRSGGDASLAALEDAHGKLPTTVEVFSGGGGRHYYFQHPGYEGLDGKLGEGLDLLADGHIVVAPPSVHESGMAYAFAPGRSFDEVELAPCPEWLLEMADKPSVRAKKPAIVEAQAVSTELVIPPREGLIQDVMPWGMTADAQLREYLRLVPSLRRQSNGSYLGHCPLHDDEHPSFTVGCSDKTGKPYWRCWACCPGSARMWDGRQVHFGDLWNLLELLSISLPTPVRLGLKELGKRGCEDYFRVTQVLGHLAEEAAMLSKAVSSELRRQPTKDIRAALEAFDQAERLLSTAYVLAGVLKIGQLYGVDLSTSPVFGSYRKLAEVQDGLDQVTDGRLARAGREIKRGILGLAEHGVGILEASQDGRRGTGFDFQELLSRPDIAGIRITAGDLLTETEKAEREAITYLDRLSGHSARGLLPLKEDEL